MVRHRVGALLIVLLLGACATPPPKLTAEQRAGIHTLRFALDTISAEQAPGIYATQDDLNNIAALVFVGPLGVKPGTSSESRDRFKAYLDHHKIDIRPILAAEFERQLRQARIFPAVSSSKGDGVLMIDVIDYGFSQSRLVSPKQRPVISLRIRLVSKDRTELWTSYKGVNSLQSDLPEYTATELYGHPENIRKSFEGLSREIAARVIEDMRGKE